MGCSGEHAGVTLWQGCRELACYWWSSLLLHFCGGLGLTDKGREIRALLNVPDRARFKLRPTLEHIPPPAFLSQTLCTHPHGERDCGGLGLYLHLKNRNSNANISNSFDIELAYHILLLICLPCAGSIFVIYGSYSRGKCYMLRGHIHIWILPLMKRVVCPHSQYI